MSNKVILPLLNVGNPTNAADGIPGGRYGAVAEEFRISKTETIVADYVTFLNAVVKYTTDSKGNKLGELEALYSAKDMGRDKQINAQILRSGDGFNGYIYTAAPGAENQPMANISWFSAARFANWMHNGQPTATGYTTDPGTETGAYTFNNPDGSKNNFPSRNGGAKYWIPSEDEWYKAAYYEPPSTKSTRASNGRYWSYPTRSNEQPFVGTQADFLNSNTANFNSIVNTVKLNPAGSFAATPSPYGLFDMAGSLWEWTDQTLTNAQGKTNSVIVRGGSWSLGFLNPLKDVRRDYSPDEVDDDTGFRLASTEPATIFYTASRPRQSISSKATVGTQGSTYTAKSFSGSGSQQRLVDMVTVGDPLNKADSNGYGRVDYTYRIGKTEITVAQYAKFLNSVATDPNAPTTIQDLWRSEMADPTEKPGKLIERTVVNDRYQYSYAPERAELPIAWTNWFSAARFANWMNNDPGADFSPTTTETGVYNLNGASTGLFTRQADAKFWIPTEDEWYKAAYYSPHKIKQADTSIPGYWTYATQSDQLPSDEPDAITSPNAANYNDMRKKGDVLTNVGRYTNSRSYYGTLDQTGNLWEWNDAVIKSTTTGIPDSRGVRGGSFSQGLLAVASSTRRDYPAGYKAPDGYLFYSDDDTGFRLAGAVDTAAFW